MIKKIIGIIIIVSLACYLSIPLQNIKNRDTSIIKTIHFSFSDYQINDNTPSLNKLAYYYLLSALFSISFFLIACILDPNFNWKNKISEIMWISSLLLNILVLGPIFFILFAAIMGVISNFITSLLLSKVLQQSIVVFIHNAILGAFGALSIFYYLKSRKEISKKWYSKLYIHFISSLAIYSILFIIILAIINRDSFYLSSLISICITIDIKISFIMMMRSNEHGNSKSYEHLNDNQDNYHEDWRRSFDR